MGKGEGMGGVGKWKWGSEREGYKRGERKIKIKVEERKIEV